MNEQKLSLRQAIQSGQLDAFVKQEEARGIGPANRAEVDAALERLIKQRQSEDQTSRSPSRDGSREK
jgi:hypothetical protein